MNRRIIKKQEKRKKIFVFDFRNAKTKLEMQKIMKESFKFPDYYGMNLDALNDMKYCIPKDSKIEFKVNKKMNDELKQYLENIKEIIGIEGDIYGNKAK